MALSGVNGNEILRAQSKRVIPDAQSGATFQQIEQFDVVMCVKISLDFCKEFYLCNRFRAHIIVFHVRPPQYP